MMRRLAVLTLGLAAALVLATGCSSDSKCGGTGCAQDVQSGDDVAGGEVQVQPDIQSQPDFGEVYTSPGDQQFMQGYLQAQAESADMTFEQLMALYFEERPYASEPGFDPLSADLLGLIDEAYVLSGAEKDAIHANGFMVTDRVRWDSHPMGYLDIYTKDLPVLITTDSILFAIHNSYDKILKTLEEQALIKTLDGILAGAHQALAAAEYQGLTGTLAEARADVDLYYSVARSLLKGELVAPMLAANELKRDELLLQIEGLEPKLIQLFGRAYPCDGPGCMYDFSQFKPRGHYTESEELKRYFRAMIWLGRTEMALTRFARDFDAAYLMLATLDAASQHGAWTSMDRAIQAFVGQSDNLNMEGFTRFLADQLIIEAAQLADPEKVKALQTALEEGGYANQKIMSQIMATDPFSPTPTALPPIFCFYGQRFVVDSYVFSNVVYDRITWQGEKPMRLMPDPLDAMFVLGFQEALPLLKEGLEQFHYSQNLHLLRYLVEHYEADFWTASMYNTWLAAFRALKADTTGEGFPYAMKTHAYALKALNTALASWAELRHDTILYVKQSYTGVGCDYPDGYVEPYPEFFSNIAQFAGVSKELFGALDLPVEPYFKDWVAKYFENLATVATTLGGIADKEVNLQPRTPDETAFIKSIVQQNGMCGGPLFTGWYADLFFNSSDTTFEFKPTIADVHTDPNTESVLHVGTGRANLEVLTVNTHCGLKAYAGPVSSYYERVEGGFNRLTDEDWKETLNGAALPPRPAWTNEFIIQ
jgi:hypothetical protein